MRLLLTCICFFLGTGHLLSQSFTVSGVITDLSTGEPLPYASVLLKGTGLGAVSDGQGTFILKEIPHHDSLIFSFLGYDSKSVFVDKAIKDLSIDLAPSIFLGPEVIIRPMEPEEYLKVVICKFKVNYPQSAYSTLSYYKQELKEDGRFLDHSEAGFYSTIDPDKLDKNRHQVALFKEAEQAELQFMRKQAEKQKKKYLKKNPEEAEDFEDGELIKSTMGGPNNLLGLHVTSGNLHMLDSTEFKGFEFNYSQVSSYMGHEVISIAYRSKGKDEGMRKSGTIYIDKDSDAVISVQEEGIMVIPIVARPILFAMGMKIENPPYKMVLKYRPMNGKWYIEQAHWDVHLKISKRHLLDKNDHAQFYIEQTLLIREVQESGYQAIPDDKIFDREMKIKGQVHAIPGVNWSRVK